MSDLDLVMQAFNKAQAEGNTEAAKSFAQMALDLDAQFSVPPLPEPEVGIGEAFSTGFERGVGRLGSTITDIIPALVGSAVGAEEYAQRQFQEAAEKEAALPAPVFPSYKDVEGVGDFTKFVAETIGEQIPNFGVALATALTGGTAAPVFGATRAAGQFAGAAFGSYALNAPEIFQNIYQETGETAPGTALLFGSAAAALDSILPATLAKNMSAPVKAEITKKILERSGMKPSVLRSGTVGLLKGVGTEGLTEGAQEAISIAAERFIDENPDIFGSDEWNRIMEASVRGAVAGGGFGTVGGGVQGAREGMERAQRLADLEESRKLRDEANKRVELLQGQLELPGIEPVSPEVLEAQIDAETARAEGAGVGTPVVSKMAALELARRRGLEVPAEGSFDSLNAEQKEVVEEVQKQESERILYEDAAIEAERQGVVFDTTKPMGELSTQELDILETVRQRRIGRYGRRQKQLFTKEGEVAPAIERQAKKAEKEQAAIDKAAKQAAEKERKAQEKLAKERRERLLGAEQLELDLQPAIAPTEVAEDAVTARQGDIFAGLPGEQTRAPSVGKALNDFLKEQGLPVNAATKKAFAGRDLAVPEQRAQVVTDLRAVAERSKSAANIDAIDNVIQQLEPTPAAPPVEAAPVAKPAVEAAPAQETTTEPAAVETKEKLTEDDIPQQGVQFFPNGKITDIGIKQLAVAHTKNMRKPKALRDSGITEAFNWFMNEDNASVTDEHLATYQKAVDAYTMNAPVYKGAAFSPEISQLATRGRLAPLLNKLIASQPPEIQRILRKIGTQNLRTRIVVGATPEGTSGFYDAAADVITLDPTSGMNEHTALHEITHAALAQALNNPDLQITKDFFDFYSQIVPTMDGFYGGQDLQEFAAELVGNPEFQALLKQIKAPQGKKTMWQTIMDAIAKFFGFRKGQSAYNKGLDFVDKILDVSQGVEPTLTDQLFLGTPNMGANAIGKVMTSGKELAGNTKESLLDGLSKLGTTSGGGRILANALRALRLNDLVTLYGDKIPALKGLRDAVLRRQGAVEKARKEAQTKYINFKKIARKKPKQVEQLAELASEARREGFDLVGVDPEFDVNALSVEQKAKFNTMMTRLRRFDSDVQQMYKDMREDYRRMYDRYKKYVLDQVKDGKKRAELEARFLRETSAPGYVPFLRFGDYFLDYTDPNTDERVIEAFESPRARQQFIDANRGNIKDEKQFDRTANATFNRADFPPTSFVSQLMDALPAEQQSIVYEQYLTLYPESSFMQRTRKAGKYRGESKNLVQGYADTMLKWVTKQGNLEYLPEIQKNINDIKSSRVTGVEASVKEEIGRREGFISNPNYGPMTSFFATSAYNLFLTGNVSSAIVNLSAVPLLSGPLLVGVYGFRKSNAALLRAMRIAKPSFKDWNSDTQTFEPAWTKNPRYASLVEGLDAMGQREHTMQREMLEGARQRAQDYDGLGAKTMNLASLPFTEAEKYSRATTAIAAYELAKAEGKSDAKAVEEAVKLVMDVHTSGMAAEGPSLMQHPVGRVMLTFKTFIWNSAVVTAMATNNALRGETAEIRSIARKQVLGIYGMSAAIAGINGLPFYGAAATLANMMAALLGDDDEPFNAKEEMRAFTNEFIYKGPLNYITNLEISNRVGLANGLLFREDPYSIEQNGYIMTAVMQAMGPVGSYALNIERNAGRLLEQGEYGRFFEAISPSALRNILKTGRYIQEGARTIDGQPILEDLNGYNLALQAFGFAPANLSSLYENRAAALNYQSQVRNKKQKILKKYYMGVTTGDSDLMREALREFTEFSRNFPGLVGPDTLERSFKSRQAYEKDLILGMKFDKGLQSKLNDKFLSEFIEP